MVDVVKRIAELSRPWVEMGVGLALVVAICMAAGIDSETAPDQQEHLMAAARGGDLRTIEKAIGAGVSVEIRDSNGLTPLMIAAREGQAGAVERLIDKGANVNARSEEFGTALMLACRNEKVGVVRVLLARGADISLGDEYGNTAETWARESGNGEILRMITPRGSDGASPSSAGTNPAAR